MSDLGHSPTGATGSPSRLPLKESYDTLLRFYGKRFLIFSSVALSGAVVLTLTGVTLAIASANALWAAYSVHLTVAITGMSIPVSWGILSRALRTPGTDSTDRELKLKRLFDLVFERSASERAALLSHLKVDASMLAELDKRLKRADPASSFMMCPDEQKSSAVSTIFRRGDIISDRYEILNFIAKGGMGEVYKAQDRELEEIVALKTLLLTNSTLTPDAVDRFKTEIKLAKEITHANVCRIKEFGRADLAGRMKVPYMTMEYLEGETLRDKIERDSPIPIADAIMLAVQMIDGLSAVHSRNIIHHDFKPSNILLIPDGKRLVVKITDFGLARAIGEAQREGVTTVSIRIGGTRKYMAPEQMFGRTTKKSDIFALGLVLHEMVTGKVPEEIPGRPERRVKPGLDSRWDRTIRGCIEVDESRRFSSVHAVKASLTRFRLKDLFAKDDTQTCSAVVRIGTWVFIIGVASLLVSSVLTSETVREAVTSAWARISHVIGGVEEKMPGTDAYFAYVNGSEIFANRQPESEEDLDLAIEQYNRALAREPSLAVARAQLALAYLWKGRLQQTEKSSWLKKAKYEIELAAKLDPNLFEVHLVRGSILTDAAKTQSELDVALRELKAAIKINPRSDEAYPKLSTYYENSGDYGKALEAARTASQLDDRSVDNFIAVGREALNLCRLDEAETAYEKAISRDANRYEGWDGKGNVLLLKGQFTPSITAYHTAIQKSKNSRNPPANPFGNIGTAYFYLGKYRKAVEFNSKAIAAANSGYYLWAGNIADCYRQLLDRAKAREYYETAISLANKALQDDPKDVNAMISLALYYARSGNRSGAHEELESMIRWTRGRAPADVVYQTAIVYALLGEPDNAIHQLSSALSSPSSCTPMQMVMNEPDLVPLRELPSFQRLVTSHHHQ